MIRNISETVIVPIAGIILSFIMTYELIQMIIDKNSFHDFETFMFFKWVFKTFAAVLIVTNTWNIVMAVFDLAQHVVNDSAGVIIGKDLIYRDGMIKFDKSSNVDNSSAKISTAPVEVAEKLIRNTYNVLLTRGIRGTFVYCEDEALNNFLKSLCK